MSLLSKLLGALPPEEADRVREEYGGRPERVSPARRRMDADKRAWAEAHALDDSPGPIELALADIYRESWEPAPPPIDQLTGKPAEPLRRPPPWFETTPINPAVHPPRRVWIRPNPSGSDHDL